jgi:hypothetical protein
MSTLEKEYGAEGGKKKIMRAFQLNEISAVDFPAQRPAKKLIIKRRDGVAKGYDDLVDVFTSSDDGHQHGIRVGTDYDGKTRVEVMYATGEDGESHDHQIMRGANGELIISENAGHTHTIDADVMQNALLNMMIGKAKPEKPVSARIAEIEKQLGTGASVAAILSALRDPAEPGDPADDVGKSSEEDVDMSDKNAGNLSAELKKRDDEIARLEAVIDLTPEYRAHYDGLTDTKKSAFLGKDDVGKAAELEAVEKANPVVYTAKDGTEYRKNDDPRLVAAIQKMDEEREDMAKFRVEAEQTAFEKKATDLLGLIPGEQIEKVALVRAVAKIDDDETRGKVEKLLEGANKVYKLAMTTVGVTEPAAALTPDNPGVKLAELAKAEKEKDPGLRDDQAMNKVLDTAEGQRLYGEYQKDRKAAQLAARN